MYLVFLNGSLGEQNLKPNYISEKRTFLTQALEARLILLYHSNGDYTQALNTVNRVMKELKKMDDKQLLMEVQLSESKVRSHSLHTVLATM